MNDEDEVSESEEESEAWEQLQRSLNLESPWQPYADVVRSSPHSYSNSVSEERSPLITRHVLTHDHECSVFPPIDHEGLFVPSQLNPLQTPYPASSPSPKSLSPPVPHSAPPPRIYQIRLVRDGFRWMQLGLALLRAKFLGVASSINDYGVVRGSVWPLVYGAGAAAAVLFCFLYAARARRRWRQHRRVRESSVDHLIGIIKEKDEKIIQLLHQIAQMNEVLLAFFRPSCGVSRDGGST